MLHRIRRFGVPSLLGKSTATTYLLSKRSIPTISHVCRSYSTDMPTTRRVECFISTHTDPFVNLAIEDYLFKTTDPEKYILYLWRNKPCVVVGRNQNPFKECNLQYMEENNIPLVRRRSGGGTVYHDMGNSIYTIFMPRTAFSRDANAELVARSLHQLDIPAYVNSRHDIAVDGFKVSGSAYKLTNRRAYHHGTMLIDTDVDMLRGALKVNKDRLVTKGVASVPSPVTNLRSYSYTIDHQQFCDAVIEEFTYIYNDNNPVQATIFAKDEISDLPEEVVNSRDELTSWDWIYGQTPEFTHDFEMDFSWGTVIAFIRSRHGKITEASLTSTISEAQEVMVISALEQALHGCKYSRQGVNDARAKIEHNIPGLINPSNRNLVKDLCHKLQLTL